MEKYVLPTSKRNENSRWNKSLDTKTFYATNVQCSTYSINYK